MKTLLPTIALAILPLAVSQAGGNHTNDGHAHSHNAAASAGDEQLWRMDVQLGYQDVTDPVVPGFLSWESHSQTAGFGLQHLDIGRSFHRDDLALNGRVNLSVHDGEVELHEAWVRQQLGQTLSWQAGMVLVDIGLINPLHAHSRRFLDAPLYQRALWGGEMSEATVRLEHSIAMTPRWRVSSALSLLSTMQQQTEKASAAGLANLVLAYQGADVQLRLKADYYQAQLNRRGLNLFQAGGATHSHGTSATEYFDGRNRHQSLALEASWQTGIGAVLLTSEYQQRTEEGELYSAAGQTTDVTADANLDSWGSFVSVGWRMDTVPVTVAVRQQWLGSDVELTNPASRDLEQSLLNHTDAEPEATSYLLTYRLGQGSLGVQLNDWQQTGLDLPEWLLSWRYGVTF